MAHDTLDRRRFLRFATAGLALSGVALLEACAQPSSPAAAPGTPTAVAAKPTAAPAAPTTAPAAAPTTAAAAAPTAAPVNAAAATSVATRGVTLPGASRSQASSPTCPPPPMASIDAAFVNYPAKPSSTVQDTPGSRRRSQRH